MHLWGLLGRLGFVRTIFLFGLIGLVLSNAVLVAQESSPVSPVVADVLKLHRAKVDEKVIVAFIKNAPKTQVSAADLIQLREQGVSSEVLVTLLSPRSDSEPAPSAPVAPEPTPAAAPVPQPSQEATTPPAPETIVTESPGVSSVTVVSPTYTGFGYVYYPYYDYSVCDDWYFGIGLGWGLGCWGYWGWNAYPYYACWYGCSYPWYYDGCDDDHHDGHNDGHGKGGGGGKGHGDGKGRPPGGGQQPGDNRPPGGGGRDGHGTPTMVAGRTPPGAAGTSPSTQAGRRTPGGSGGSSSTGPATVAQRTTPTRSPGGNNSAPGAGPAAVGSATSAAARNPLPQGQTRGVPTSTWSRPERTTVASSTTRTPNGTGLGQGAPTRPGTSVPVNAQAGSRTTSVWSGTPAGGSRAPSTGTISAGGRSPVPQAGPPVVNRPTTTWSAASRSAPAPPNSGGFNRAPVNMYAPSGSRMPSGVGPGISSGGGGVSRGPGGYGQGMPSSAYGGGGSAVSPGGASSGFRGSSGWSGGGNMGGFSGGSRGFSGGGVSGGFSGGRGVSGGGGFSGGHGGRR